MNMVRDLYLFRPGDILKYYKPLDFDLYVCKVTYQCDEYVKMKVRYLNNHTFLPENRVIDTRPQTIKIQTKHLSHWRIIEWVKSPVKETVE